MSLKAIDRELEAFKREAGAPREIRLGCTTTAHERFGFCSACESAHTGWTNPLELMCWRLLAMREAELAKTPTAAVEAIVAAKLPGVGGYYGANAERIIEVLHEAGFLVMHQSSFDPYQQTTDATGFSTTPKTKA